MRSVHIFFAGLFLDVLCVCLYEHLQNMPYTVWEVEREAVVYGTLFTLMAGIILSLMGAIFMGRSASGTDIIGTELVIALLTILFFMRAKIGMDDPLVLVPWFAGLVALVMVLGRVVSHRR